MNPGVKVAVIGVRVVKIVEAVVAVHGRVGAFGGGGGSGDIRSVVFPGVVNFYHAVRFALSVGCGQ